MNIKWKAKICSGMDVVEKIKFVKEGIDKNGKKWISSAVYVPSDSEIYKTRADWSDIEINEIANKLSDSLDKSIIAATKVKI